MTNITTEVVRRIFDDDEGAFLEVGPGCDGFGISISTTSETSIRWFGKFELTLSKEMARGLGNALLAAAEDCQ